MEEQTLNPQKLDKWHRWMGNANIDGSIESELTNLAVVRLVFSGVKEMVQSNKKVQRHSAFHSVFAANYAHSVLMYIRRQVRRHRDSISLIGLLDDLLENAESISRDYHVGFYTRDITRPSLLEHKNRVGNGTFDRYFAGEAGNHLCSGIVAADIAILEGVFEHSSSFADRRIAHLDKRSPDTIPTFGELEYWCDTLNETYWKYHLLLTAADLQITPILNHNWKEIFQHAWIADEEGNS
ncbi:MAG: hypothetical protein ABJF88_08130 [Rhodothermales bacterium]